MTVRQRIYDVAGAARDVSTPTVMFWAGDGHRHWHVRDAEGYELRHLDNGRQVGTGAKHGFCYYDNTRYRLTATADWFLESNDANNATWLNLKLTGAGVGALGQGPAA
jgi:hypothetical protein